MSSTNQPLVGVAAALAGVQPTSTALSQFVLTGRVAFVTGGHRGIGLEVAVALAEAGAIVYCLDLARAPDADWVKVQKWVANLGTKGRLEYLCGNVTEQIPIWDIALWIAKKEKRLDICVANAGILRSGECLSYPAEGFRELLDVNVTGVLLTAQAAGRQMELLGNGGSIILIGSMSGSITNKDQHWVAYNSSKAAVVQMARSLACELGPKKIRVNSLSPGYIYTQMTRDFLEPQPELAAEWSSQNPLGRLGRPDELRGVVLWLASDASTFCNGSDIVVDGGHRAW